MKICTKCKENKDLDKFSKDKRRKDGFECWCKDCKQIVCKTRYANNYHLYDIAARNWQKNNPNKVLEASRAYKLANPEKVKEMNEIWTKNNAAKKCIATAKRRANKLKATPKWLTLIHLEKIESIYKFSITLQKLFNIKFHVDHIIPLQGKMVSGLHVPWNLQILSAQENLSKSNKLI